MNTKDNTRSKNTRKSIRDAFIQLLQEKEFEKITVQELCRRAAINRTTFYSHYLDLYDLMEKMERELQKGLQDTFIEEETGALREADGRFEAMFCLIRENREFYRTYFNQFPASRVLAFPYPELFYRSMEELACFSGFQSRRQIDFHIEFFKAGVWAITKKWLNDGCRESPEEMAQIIVSEYSGRWDAITAAKP